MMNPIQLIQMAMGNPGISNNPLVKNAMEMKNANDVSGLQQMAQNIASQKGVNLQDLQDQMEQRFGRMR